MRLVRLRSSGGGLEATFAPEAGLVGSSLTHRGEELLAQRKGLDEYARSGSTFGIPFLHPWANRLADFGYAVAGQEVELDRDSPLLRIEEHGLPIHGLAPYGLSWEVEERGDALTAETEVDRDRLEAFPFPHRLRVEATLADDALTISTTLTAAAAVPVPVAFGYHPYLVLPGVPRAEWEVELPVENRLLLDENMIPTGEEEPPSFRRGPLEDRSLDDGLHDARAPAPVHRLGRRPHARRRVPRGLHARAGLRPRRQGPHLLRADDRARERPALARRPAARADGRAVHGRVPHHRRWLTATPTSAPRPRPRRC